MKIIYKYVLKLFLKYVSPFHNWFIDRISIKAYGGIHPKNIYKFRSDFFLSKVNPSSVVLDIACGTGQMLKHLAPHIKSGIGVDYDPENILKANHGLLANLNFVCSDILNTNYSQWNFDTVILSHILEHLNDPVTLLKQFINKRLLICVPSQENWRAQLKKSLGLFYFSDKTHLREYTQEALKRELNEAGFSIHFLGFNSEGEINCVASRS